MQQALNLALAHGGYRRGLAAALNSLGWVHAVLGNAEEAIDYSQQSLDLFKDLGDRWGEAATLDTIGYAHHHLGDHQLAARYFEQALEIDGSLGDVCSEATVYDHLRRPRRDPRQTPLDWFVATIPDVPDRHLRKRPGEGPDQVSVKEATG